ncbi:MAG: bifunctional diguanylate cyclase/phosphodiesterase [Kangiellaceae bacterium]|nr:bifunctional diguanylate cyclase/phosphodiesterase [Kangiellaceae bacterium]
MEITRPRFFRLNIVVIYLAILLAGGWVSLSVFQNGHSIQNVSHTLTTKQLPALSQISEVKKLIIEYERVAYELYATTSVDYDERETIMPLLQNTAIEIRRNINLLDQYFSSNSSLGEVTELFELIQKHAAQLDHALPPEFHDWDQSRAELAEISKLNKLITPLLFKLSSEINAQIEQSKENSTVQLDEMSVWVSAFSIMIILLAILVGYYIYRQAKLSAERQRLALFVEKNPNPVACIGYDGSVAFENLAWRENCENDLEQFLVLAINQEIEKMRMAQSNVSSVKFARGSRYFELSINRIDALQQHMVHVEDITTRESATQELEFLAYHDSLTGLPNLKKLENDLSKMIEKGSDYPFYLISVGIKRLQLITTTHGHSVSDALIKSIVMRLQNLLAGLLTEFEVCRIYRFTGAKFEILVSGPKQNMGFEQMIKWLEKQLDSVSQKPLNTNFGQFFLGIQVGCATFPEHGYNADILMKNASAALNDAQKNNIDGINQFSHELAYREENWLKVEHELRQADFDQELFLVYQPKVNLASGELEGMEALVRWQHPEKGLISPADFIPVAEESGLILAMGDWILRQAIKQTAQWVKNGASHLQVAINVSPSQLLSSGFCEQVNSILNEESLDPCHVEIEITEEVMVEDKSLCVKVMQALRESGMSIAIDDFGTGYSSLSYLNQMPLSKLKIDRAFVTNIHCNESNYAIVRTIIALSKSLNMKVIAEGIETQDEVDMLKSLNCDQGQGFLFSKPLSVSDFESLYISPNKNSHLSLI